MLVQQPLSLRIDDPPEVTHSVRLKASNDRGEFELDRARSKNNIAENSFALRHETDNSNGMAYMSRDVSGKITCVVYIT